MSLPPSDRIAPPFDVELPQVPYPGLRPFETDEWPVFFGREKMTDEVINQLIQKHLVVVHGDSGCGKSSLIRAGVLAQLEQEHARSGASWRTCTMLPREAPLWGLAQALAELDDRADDTDHVREIRRRLNLGVDAPTALAEKLRQGEDDHICILVDQFEELFTFARRHGTDEARVFVDVLISLQRNPPPGLYGILTMRSEFLGVCARYGGLAEAVNKTQYLLSRMERSALLRAVREPAPLYGGEVTWSLAERLIADAGGGQDQLALIQHGLMLMWRRKVGTGMNQQVAEPYRKGRRPEWSLGLVDYKSAGGLVAMLSNHADDIMEAVAPDAERKKIVEHLFRALTDVNAEGYAVRRPQTLGELQQVTAVSKATLDTIVDAFRADGVSFLNPYGADQIGPDRQIDISHEALIRCWRNIADEQQGWLQHEFRDGLIWKTLRMMAEKGETLSPTATTDRDAWLNTLPSEAWAKRYGGGWDDVQQLMKDSRKARDDQAKRQHELDQAKMREAEALADQAKMREAKARSDQAEDARRAAAELANKEQELRAAQEKITVAVALRNIIGMTLLPIGLVVLSVVVMRQFDTEEFYQGIVAGLIPALALFVASSIKEGLLESENEARGRLSQKKPRLLFVSLIFMHLVLWGLMLAWFSSFQSLEGRLIADKQLVDITPYADQAFQKSVAGMLLLSSWLPLTVMACLLLGILFGRLQFWSIAVANLISIGSCVLVIRLIEILDVNMSIEIMFETMFQGSLHDSSMITWDQTALMVMAAGAGFALLFLLSVIMSISISTGAWFGRRAQVS